MEKPPLPAFNEALKRLTPQLVALECEGESIVSERTLRYWRSGDVPNPILLLIAYPELITALLADLEPVTILSDG